MSAAVSCTVKAAKLLISTFAIPGTTTTLVRLSLAPGGPSGPLYELESAVVRRNDDVLLYYYSTAGKRLEIITDPLTQQKLTVTKITTSTDGTQLNIHSDTDSRIRKSRERKKPPSR